jgi:hypothetical protein
MTKCCLCECRGSMQYVIPLDREGLGARQGGGER